MKIETKKDQERKSTRSRTRTTLDDLDEGEIGKMDFIDAKIKESKERNALKTTDRVAEEAYLKKLFQDAGYFAFDKYGNPDDKRVTPQEKKKMLEFASELTERNPNYIVELAGTHFSVYSKDGDEYTKREHIYEFADYSDYHAGKVRRIEKKDPNMESGD